MATDLHGSIVSKNNESPIGMERDMGGFMLVGKIAKSSRERLMVTIAEHKGVKVIDLRVYNIINDGELSPTAEGLTFAPEKVDSVIELLKEAQKKIVAS